MAGRKHSDKTKSKISKAAKAMWRSPERLNKNLSGENHPNSKLTRKSVYDIREKYKIGDTTYSKLAKQYNVSIITIMNVVKNKIWKE